MNANKVILNGKTLLDLTQDGTEEANVGAGVKFHKPSGQPSVGTAVFGGGSGGSGVPITLNSQEEAEALLANVTPDMVGKIYSLDGALFTIVEDTE